MSQPKYTELRKAARPHKCRLPLLEGLSIGDVIKLDECGHVWGVATAWGSSRGRWVVLQEDPLTWGPDFRDS